MSVFDIVLEMDHAVDEYKKRNDILARDMDYKDGFLADSRKYNEFQRRKNHIFEEYDQKCRGLRNQLEQAKLFHKKGNSCPMYMPREVCFGTGHLQYAGLDEKIPLVEDFPLDRAGYVSDKDRDLLVYRMLCLLRSLPEGKCAFYVYDPDRYGASIGPLSKLFNCPEAVPSHKAYGRDELSDLLIDLQNNLKYLNQQILPHSGATDWKSYNSKIKERKDNPQKLIPFRVIVLFGLPQGADRGALEEIINIEKVGHDSGVYCMFSIQERDEETSRFDSANESIKKMVELAEPLDQPGRGKNFLLQHLTLSQDNSNVARVLAKEKNQLWIEDYEKRMMKRRLEAVALSDLLSKENLYAGSAVNGLSIPLGTGQDGNLCNLRMGDEPVHVLIGGATGSGKSNLIHDIILNACWKYSPNELQLYLLDYKEGVEFNKYALGENILPHAALIAKYADVGYGLTVIGHLMQEYTKRAERFKKVGVGNYATYRKQFPEDILPRIVLIIDEFQTLYQETTEIERLKSLILDLAKKGRNGGIHMIFATQTLKGLSDFHDAKSQFLSRLVCKCSIEDCSEFLNYNNDAAASIGVPRVVFNEQNGLVDYNRIFSAPEVKDIWFEKAIKEMHSACKENNILHAENRIFDGEEMPNYPKDGFVIDDSFYLGQKTDYEESPFLLSLSKGTDENLLIFGKNTDTLRYSILAAGEQMNQFEQVDYIGNRLIDLPTSFMKIAAYDDLSDFFSSSANSIEELEKAKHLLVIDHIPWGKGADRNEQKEWDNRISQLCMLSSTGTYIIAFFDSVNEWKRYWPDRNIQMIFRHVIGYNMAPQDWDLLNNNIEPHLGTRLARGKRYSTRAIYVHEEKATVFKPFHSTI